MSAQSPKVQPKLGKIVMQGSRKATHPMAK